MLVWLTFCLTIGPFAIKTFPVIYSAQSTPPLLRCAPRLHYAMT
ncbi:unnamed protein product, partial [Tenebrio molitor]